MYYMHWRCAWPIDNVTDSISGNVQYHLRGGVCSFRRGSIRRRPRLGIELVLNCSCGPREGRFLSRMAQRAVHSVGALKRLLCSLVPPCLLAPRCVFVIMICAVVVPRTQIVDLLSPLVVERM